MRIHTKPEALARGAVAVDYELSMLRSMAQRIRPTTETADDNAFLESFLTHYRNMMDFLYTVRCQHTKDDVLAGDYSSSWTPPERPDLPDVRGRINKALSHITYNRETQPYKIPWRVNDMLQLIDRDFRTFLASLDRSHRTLFGEQPEGDTIVSTITANSSAAVTTKMPPDVIEVHRSQ